MIVVDASAIVAMLTGEPEADALMAALGRTSEISDVAGRGLRSHAGACPHPQAFRRGRRDRRHGVLAPARVVVQPIQPETAHVALEAFARYGKGRGHPARLNLGDCFIYAQAKVGGASLLYKGDDFSKTDIESAS